jgi:hypothetical protein
MYTKVTQAPVISMPAAMKTNWLNALRSGEYKQATGVLCREDHETGAKGFCCLGVLQQIVSGDVERYSSGIPDSVPSLNWLSENGIAFNGGSQNNPVFIAYNEEVAEQNWTSAAELNDNGASFTEIADILEPLIETY